MGKGDKKSKRGKIVLGTYGVRRLKKTRKKIVPPVSAPVVEIVEPKPEVKKPAPKRKSKTAAPPKEEQK